MKKVIRLTESDLIKIVKRVLNENESNPGKFGEYEIKKFKSKGFTKVSDTKYKKGDITIDYKYFPKEKIDGFVAKKGNQVLADKPADACWSWFDETFGG